MENKVTARNPITEGCIWKGMLLFALPIMLGSLLQQLYNTADAVIVGRALGKAALASVGGSSGRITNLLVNAFVALSSGASVIVAGGYGMGSKENFDLVFELADVLGAEVGASRAAVDAGFADHARQVGQTGVTVRPKLYIACGISGQIQHTAGMDGSAMIISINTDPEAPINKIADYAITGDVNEIIPKMIKYYKQNSK